MLSHSPLNQYHGQPDESLAQYAIVQARVVSPILVLDLSRANEAATREFFAELQRDPRVASALAESPYRGDTALYDAFRDPKDYSVGRALGHAVWYSSNLSGIAFETTRSSDRPGESGDNLVLFAKQETAFTGLEVHRVTCIDPAPRHHRKDPTGNVLL